MSTPDPNAPTALPGDEFEDADANPAAANTPVDPAVSAEQPPASEPAAGSADAVTDSSNDPALPVDPDTGQAAPTDGGLSVASDVGTSPSFSTTADQSSETTVPPLADTTSPGDDVTSPAVDAANATIAAPVASNVVPVTDGTGPATADVPTDTVLTVPVGDPASPEGVSAPGLADTTSLSDIAAPSGDFTDGVQTDGLGVPTTQTTVGPVSTSTTVPSTESSSIVGDQVTTSPTAVSDQTLPSSHPAPTVFDSPAYDDVPAILGTPAPLAPGEGSTGDAEPPSDASTDAQTSTVDTRVAPQDRASLGTAGLSNELAEDIVSPVARLLAEQGVSQSNVQQWVDEAYGDVSALRSTAVQQGDPDPYPLAG